MGYDRLTAARITLLVDCASPPDLPVSHHAHASTLAFEMSSGRHPIVVNCGAGRKFSTEWERKCRATVSHNTVAIEKISSSRISPKGVVSKTFGERLLDTPANVTRSRKADLQGNWLLATHDGYVEDYGLVHQRRIFLSPDGREFRGQDSLTQRAIKNANSSKLQLQLYLVWVLPTPPISTCTQMLKLKSPMTANLLPYKCPTKRSGYSVMRAAC